MGNRPTDHRTVLHVFVLPWFEMTRRNAGMDATGARHGQDKGASIKPRSDHVRPTTYCKRKGSRVPRNLTGKI
jgi:hypothetical protein